MPEPEPIDTRVSRLEREGAQLRERVADSTGDAAAARVLASGADRDVSEVWAHLRTLSRRLSHMLPALAQAAACATGYRVCDDAPACAPAARTSPATTRAEPDRGDRRRMGDHVGVTELARSPFDTAPPGASVTSASEEMT